MLLGGYSNSFSIDSVPDLYLVKVDSLGGVIWEATYGGPYSDYGEQAKFLSGGNNEIGFIGTSSVMKKSILVTDLFFIKIDSYGNKLEEILKVNTSDLNSNSNAFEIAVYPNPARNQFFVKTSDTIRGEKYFKLFDVSGKLIKAEQMLVNPYLVKLGVKLSTGAYIYQVENNGLVKFGRIILND